MATKRFNYIGDLSLKNTNVGIGTSTPTDKIEIVGGTRGADLKVAGIATLSSYSGFDNRKFEAPDKIWSIDSGKSATLSGEVVVSAGSTLIVGTGATIGQGSIESLKVSNTFTPPIGGTVDRPTAPKPGALFYNKDFKTIEYWDGNFWKQVDNVTRRGRGVVAGGNNPGSVGPSVNHNKNMEYIEIATTGNAQNFGDLEQSSAQLSSYGNQTRGVWNGFGESSTTQDYMQYAQFASTGNAVDFGNLTVARRMSGACASSTRGIIAGGKNGPDAQDVIDYCEIESLGNAVDFGNLSTARRMTNCAAASAIRAVFAGGGDPNTAMIDYVTISHTGNAHRFGDAIWAGNYRTGCSNSKRGFWGTGYGGQLQKTVETQVLASGGNTYQFGDLTTARYGSGAASTQIRGVWMGGYVTPTYANVIDYITFESSGEGVEFGDLSHKRAYCAGCSDSAGGVGGF